MQKRFLITLLTIILIITLTLTVHISFVNASPVTFNMDTLPENEGWRKETQPITDPPFNSTSYVSDGILTIQTDDGYLNYYSPADWSNTVNDTKGWIFETRMKIDPKSNDQAILDYGTVRTYIHSKEHVIALLFFKDRISLRGGLLWTDYFMNTTDTFHVYRLESKGDIIRFFIDGKLIINSFVETVVLTSTYIEFGSYVANTISYWDYVSYDTNPTNLTVTFPTLTVVNGTSSYYISNITTVTSDSSLNYVIPNGIYPGWCVDKSVVMIRNEAHNVILYSSLNSTLPSYIERYNWSSVNYILNHKQGSMQEIQNAIWYFVPDRVTPASNETNTWNMINEAKANSNYVPGKGEIMAMIAYAGFGFGTSTRGSGVQSTIIEYRIP